MFHNEKLKILMCDGINLNKVEVKEFFESTEEGFFKIYFTIKIYDKKNNNIHKFFYLIRKQFIEDKENLFQIIENDLIMIDNYKNRINTNCYILSIVK